MDREEAWSKAQDRVNELEAAIRKHRDYRGDDRCWMDDNELYAVLPEGDTRPAKDTAVLLVNCQQFIACRQAGRTYVSPQRRIEELEKSGMALLATCHDLQDKLKIAYERIGGQSEIITKLVCANTAGQAVQTVNELLARLKGNRDGRKDGI